MASEPPALPDLDALKARWNARLPFQSRNAHGRSYCAGCRAADGEYHQEGCDHELCPHCGAQRLFCGCNAALAGNAFPALLAEIDRLTASCAQLQREREIAVAAAETLLRERDDERQSANYEAERNERLTARLARLREAGEGLAGWIRDWHGSEDEMSQCECEGGNCRQCQASLAALAAWRAVVGEEG